MTLRLQKRDPGNSPEIRQISSEEVNSGLLAVPVGPLQISRSRHSNTDVALSLILPTLNEAENIQSVVEQLDQTLRQIGITYEIIIVDDDSPDRTWERGLAMAETLPRLRVMRRMQQRGLATAVVRGWQAARGEILGVIDADLQHPPAVLPALWHAIASGADLAVASRWAPGGGVSDWSSRRRLISRTAQAIGRVVLPDVFGKVSDPLSGFFLVRREKLAAVTMDPRGYKILVEVLARTRIQRTAEVSYVFRERVGARSKATWRVYRDYLLHLAILRGSAISPAKSLARRVHPSLPIIIFVVALACRIVALGMVQQWPVKPDSDLWKSGLEIVNIATSITSHHGFASPFATQSGPTAWIPPVYPYFVAAVFSFFRLRSNLAAVVILSTQAVFSALTCFPIYLAGKKALGTKTARWASWGWALFPYTVLIPGLFIWETSLSALLLAWLWYLCMDLTSAHTLRLAGIGVLWGIAALTNTALLSVMPFFLLWPYRSKIFSKTWTRPVVLVGFTFVLVVSPWLLRDWRALGVVVPLRSNFGEELWLGNHDGGSGRIILGLSPSDNEAERERYKQLGEVAYLARRRQEALSFISRHPNGFIRGVLFRFRYWWYAEGESAPVFYLYRLITLMAAAGIVFAWRTRTRGADLPIIVLIVFPLVYYLTDVYARYRHPIEPFMILLGAFAASQCFEAIKTKVSNKSMV